MAFVLGLNAGCGHYTLSEKARQRNLILTEIIQREDRREFGDAFYWQRLLDTGDDPQLWDRALAALARIGDPKALPLLQRHALQQSSGEAEHPGASSSVRERIAFAIGEIEDYDTRWGRAADISAVDLLVSMTQDSSLLVRARAAEALGKIRDARGGPAVLALLPDRQAVLTSSEQAATGLVLTAIFRLQDRRALPKVLALADYPDADIKWQVGNCVYRLLLNVPGESAPLVLAALRPRLADNSPMVRGYAARALSLTKDPSLVSDLVPLLDDSDYFAQVEAVNALGRLQTPAAVDFLMEKLGLWLDDLRKPAAAPPKIRNLAVLMFEALGAIGDPKAGHLINRFRYRQDPVSNAAEVAAAKIFKGQDDFFGRHVEHLLEMRGYWTRFTSPESLRAAVTALGEHGSETAIAILRDLMAQEKGEDRLFEKVRPAMLEAMFKLNPPEIESILRQHLGHEDDVTRRVAAALIGKLKDRTSVSNDTVADLLAAYDRPFPNATSESRCALIATLAKFDDHPAVTDIMKVVAVRDPHRLVRAAAVQYLNRKTGQDFSQARRLSETHIDEFVYMLAASGRKNTTLAGLETSRGNIELELFPEEAPLTVHNFVQLARKGYFNSLRFMRVVPNFVVQTGDPRNDMEGGPGYTLRCEINLRPFLRGSVGMALAGKDTGGSQFFISLSPQPHLDGGYTVFGRVLAGMDIVENLVPTDTIINVAIREIPALPDAP